MVRAYRHINNNSLRNNKVEPGHLAQSGASRTANQGVAGRTPIRRHSFVEIGQETISTTILTHPLIQEGQLSVIGERMDTKYW